jgi:hypothetical protein
MRLPERLPPIAGWGRRVFTLVWLVSLAAAIVAPLGGAWLRLPAIGTAKDAVSLAIDLLPPVLLVATAILLFVRRRQDSVAALLSLSFLMMAAAFFAAEGFFRAVELGWLRELFAHAGRCLLILVLLTFPDGRFSPRWSVWVAAGLLAWGLGAALRGPPRNVEYAGYLVFLALSVLSIAIPYRRLAGGLERQQVRWVLFGFAGGTVLLVIATLVSLLPGGASGPGLKTWTALAAQSLAALGMGSFTLGLIISLLRYRLYDAEAAISRSAGYAVLTLLLGLSFAIVVKAVEYLVQTWLGQEAGGLSGAIAAGLAVLMVTPLKDRVQGWAERRFQKELLTLRRDLPECMADLRDTGATDELVEEVFDRVSAGVRAARMALLFGPAIATRAVSKAEVRSWLEQETPDDNADTLDCKRADPLFPMRIPLRVRHTSGKPLGWLLLGPRPDGSLYGKAERAALGEIADPVARALSVVRHREQREAQQETRLAALEAKFDALAQSKARPRRER